MKLLILIILSAFSLDSYFQLQNGIYKGLERMCWKNNQGKIECYDSPRKWYHLNTVYLRNDTVFLYKQPIILNKKDTIFSASDGAFYYYFGKIFNIDTTFYIQISMNNCDYCGRVERVDSTTGYHYPVIDTQQFKISLTKNGFSFNGVNYHFSRKQLGTFGEGRFYIDETSIYRINPKGQYKLISQSIQDFLKSDSLKIRSDTIFICYDRLDRDIFADKDTVLENLTPLLLNIHYLDKKIVYLSYEQTKAKLKVEKIPFRIIQVGEIRDYLKVSAIELSYKIAVPAPVKKFSERQFSNSLRYQKINGNYVLMEMPEMDWSLIEK